MPSARPRKSDSDPSVTMSGGMSSAEINAAFRTPPAHPASKATAAAAPIGRLQSRYAAPKTTAARPIMAPTDRSIPPVTRIGVIATASRPTSTLRRITSKRFDGVAKFGADAANRTASIPSAARRIRLGTGERRPGNARARGVDGHGRQNDRALQRALPLRAHAEERQRRPDGAEQRHAEHRARQRAAAAGNRRASDDDRSDHFHFEPDAGVARNLIEPNRVQQR